MRLCCRPVQFADRGLNLGRRTLNIVITDYPLLRIRHGGGLTALANVCA